MLVMIWLLISIANFVEVSTKNYTSGRLLYIPLCNFIYFSPEFRRSALYIGCVYMPTDSTSVAVVESCYGRLKEDVLSFRENGRVVLLGDFNARVGRSVEVDDVIGMFGEDTCNASGNRLISFLNEVELVVGNGKLVVESEWTSVRPRSP